MIVLLATMMAYEYCAFSQTVTHDIVQEEQEKLAKTLEALASAVDGLQKEKRRRLDDTLAEFAKSAMAEVDLKVRGTYLDLKTVQALSRDAPLRTAFSR